MARKRSLTAEIRQLKIGESAIFPIERLATVQSSASWKSHTNLTHPVKVF